MITERSPCDLVILVIIIISQVLGHMNFDMNPQEENSMNMFNMDEVKGGSVRKRQVLNGPFPKMIFLWSKHMGCARANLSFLQSFQDHCQPIKHSFVTFQGPYILDREPFPILYLHTSSGDQAWLQHIPYLLPGHWRDTEAGHLVLMEQGGGDNKVINSQRCVREVIKKREIFRQADQKS